MPEQVHLDKGIIFDYHMFKNGQFQNIAADLWWEWDWGGVGGREGER